MTHSNRCTDRRNRKPRPFALEPLERRALLSLGAESSATVNTITANAQFDSANASSANGRSVVVWTDTVSSTNNDIHAQRFDASGKKTGPEIVVSASILDERQPSVAMDNQGNFVVAWRQTNNGDTNVVARRFNASGQAVGSLVQVGVGTFKEHNPSVGMDNSGNFVVAYTRDTNNNNPDVFAKRFGSNNQLLSVSNVAVSSAVEDNPSIAVAPDGRFDVAWEQTASATEHDVMMKQFFTSGVRRWTSRVSFSSGFNSLPRVAMNTFDNAVVVWQQGTGFNTEIDARQVAQDGEGQTGIVVAKAPLSRIVRNPTVAMHRTTNAFVVAYELVAPRSPGIHTRVAEVANNQVITSDVDAGARTLPAVSINGANKYLVTYTSNDSGDLNIRRRTGVLS